jgi:hypothetical protein
MQLFVFTTCVIAACQAFIIPLQTLISVQATAAAIGRNINKEIISEGRIISSIMSSHYIGSDIVSTSIIGFALINKITNNNNTADEKWSKIPVYSNTKKTINIIALVIMIIFTKNVENAI